MGVVNVSITVSSVDLTEYLLGYERNVDICTGIGALVATFDPSVPSGLTNGSQVAVYENGSLRGIFYISTTERDPTKGYSIHCQDRSKRLQEYFVSDMYDTLGYSSKYWISTICDEAQVNVSFKDVDDEGYYLNPHHTLGFEYAYDIILRLCQQSGWYFYFNSGGTCVIGTLDTSWSSNDFDIIESNGNIISEYIDTNDQLYRNRVVVWGGGSTETGDQIIAELSTRTGYDRNSNDKRTVVFSNGYIQDTDTAYELGKKILDEFSKNVSTKMYTLAGAIGVTVGDIAHCKTDVFNGLAMVYSLAVRVNVEKGITTDLVLDSRCPRLFGYWAYGDDYVYVGTQTQGVYRKLLSGSTWTDYSAGMVNKNIRDLKIKNGVLIATTDSKEAYKRNVVEAYWTQITPDTFIDPDTSLDVSTNDFLCRGCGIDTNTGSIVIGYYDPTNNISWVMYGNTDNEDEFTWKKVIINGEENGVLVDTDNNDMNNVALVEAQSTLSNDMIEGSSLNASTGFPMYGFDMVGYGSTEDIIDPPYLTDYATTVRSPFIQNNKAWFLDYSSGDIEYFDFETQQTTTYTMDNTNLDIYSTTYSYFMYVPADELTVHIIGYTSTFKWAHFLADLTSLDYTVIDSDIGVPVPGYTTPRMQNKHCLAFYNGSTSGTSPYTKTYSLWVYNMLTETSYSADSGNLYYGNYDVGTYALDNSEFNTTYNIAESTIALVVSASIGLEVGPLIGGYVDVGHYTYAVVEFDMTDNTMTAYSTQLVASYQLRYTIGTPYASVASASSGTGKGYTGVGYADSYYDSGPSYYVEHGVVIEHPGATVFKSYNRFFDTDGAPDYDPVDWTYDSKYIATFRELIHSSSSKLYCIQQIGYYNYYVHDIVSGSSVQIPDATGFYFSYSKIVDETDDTIIYADYYGDKTLKGISMSNGAFVKEYDISTPLNTTYMTQVNGYLLKYKLSEGRGMRIYETDPGIGTLLVSDGFTVLDNDTFGAIGTIPTSSGQKVFLECPIDSSSLVFGGTVPSGIVTTSGLAYISVTNDANDLEEYPRTIYNNGGSSYELAFISDMRKIELMGDVPDISGSIFESEDVLNQYVLATSNRRMLFRPIDNYTDDWKIYRTSISGIMYKLEVANYSYTSPYTFYSLSGEPSVFFQRNPGEDNFIEYSDGLPESNITVIRLDDRI